MAQVTKAHRVLNLSAYNKTGCCDICGAPMEQPTRIATIIPCRHCGEPQMVISSNCEECTDFIRPLDGNGEVWVGIEKIRAMGWRLVA